MDYNFFNVVVKEMIKLMKGKQLIDSIYVVRLLGFFVGKFFFIVVYVKYCCVFVYGGVSFWKIDIGVLNNMILYNFISIVFINWLLVIIIDSIILYFKITCLMYIFYLKKVFDVLFVLDFKFNLFYVSKFFDV